MTTRYIGLCSFVLLSMGTLGHAQTLPSSVQECASERDDARRLACYDREISQLNKGSESQASSDQSDASPPQEKFGYRGKVARDELDREAEKDVIDRLEGTVAAVSTLPRGELVVTLDNGQVWQQKSPDRRIRAEVGDRIAIKKAAFGSFMLVTAEGRGTRVTRVK